MQEVSQKPLIFKNASATAMHLVRMYRTFRDRNAKVPRRWNPSLWKYSICYTTLESTNWHFWKDR